MQSSKSSGGGNILFMIIKIKCPTGENFEIMTFRCLKTLVFDKFLTKLQHYLFFYSWRVLLVITNPLLYDYSTLSPHIHLSPIHFRKIDMNTKNSGGFIRFFAQLFRRGMIPCMVLVFFYTPENIRKSKDFLMFSGGIEKNQ